MNGNIDCYVIRADSDFIEIKTNGEPIRSKLHHFGYIGSDLMVKFVGNENDKSKEMSMIRDLGIPFSAGRGWSPSAVFDFLREKGMLSGVYREIYWIGDGKYKIETK